MLCYALYLHILFLFVWIYINMIFFRFSVWHLLEGIPLPEQFTPSYELRMWKKGYFFLFRSTLQLQKLPESHYDGPPTQQT